MRKTALTLWLLLCLLLAGCTRLMAFDPETEGAVDVILREGDRLLHYAVSGDGRVQKTTAFEGDAITVYEVDSSCFDTYRDIDENGRGGFVNRLADVRIWDENGDLVPGTPALMRVLQAASWLEHDLFTVRILRAGEAYFLYVELNVNLWTPCALYWYDPVRNGLVELYEFDSRETIGLRVRDLSLLADRPVVRAAWHVNNPLRSFCGGRYLLRMQGDGVNLISDDGVIIRDVTGYWSVHGRETGFVSAAGYHVLDEVTGEIAFFGETADLPEKWAACFARDVTELRFAHRPGAVRDPLLVWYNGRYQLRMVDGELNLYGPDGLVARRVTGCWYVGSAQGRFAGFISADGYHVLNDETGDMAAFPALQDVPDEYREYFAEGSYTKMDRFSFAYGMSDFAPALEDLRQLFAQNRTVCDEAAAVVSHQPEWFAAFDRIIASRHRGYAQSPDWPVVRAALDAMCPRYIGQEHGAVYLHFTLVADNGRSAPTRLYYAPETAELCSSGWTLWEELGGGWYLASLTE